MAKKSNSQNSNERLNKRRAEQKQKPNSQLNNKTAAKHTKTLQRQNHKTSNTQKNRQSNISSKSKSRTAQAEKGSKTSSPVRISFLGGLNEIGKNMTLYEFDGDMIIVDCGLSFP